MRRYVAFGVLGIAAIWLAWAGGRMAGPGSAEAAGDFGAQPQALEMKFTGGWMWDVYFSETPFEVLLALNGGGALLINDTTRVDRIFNCTGIGSWKAIGQQEIAGTFIVFLKDSNKGNLVYYQKPSFTMTLSTDGNRMEGAGVMDYFLPGQDPLDPEETPAWQEYVPLLIAQRIPAQ